MAKKEKTEQQEEKDLDLHAGETVSEEAAVPEENPCGTLQKEYDELNDRFLRLLAEYENFKNRTVKEKQDIYVSATADVIGAVLPVLDAVSRAGELSPENEGISLIKKQLEETLRSLGVEEIAAVGAEFDPALHNAVFHVEDEACAENTIVEEFAKGYQYRGKVIRHSMVKVAN